MSLIRTLPFAALSATLLAAGGASAQSMSSIDAREAYEQREIDRGIRNGSLTSGEASRLERGMDRIERYEDRARADGRVSPYERERLDRMLDREQRSIYRETHDNQRADGRDWGGRDGWGHDGWGRDGGRHDGYRDARGWDRDGWNRGNQYGWEQGVHNGWDGNRPNGIERRDARNEQRIYNGVRDGSINRQEFGQLQRGQERIDRYEARARSDGVVTPYERNRIEQMQNRESRQIYTDRHNGATAPTTPTTGTGSHSWNGGWQHTPQGGNTAPTTPTQPTTGTHNWGGGYRPQPVTQPTQPTQQTQPTQPTQPTRNWGGGYRMQQASAAPTMSQPTMTRASAPAPTGGRSFGGRR